MITRRLIVNEYSLFTRGERSSSIPVSGLLSGPVHGELQLSHSNSQLHSCLISTRDFTVANHSYNQESISASPNRNQLSQKANRPREGNPAQKVMFGCNTKAEGVSGRGKKYVASDREELSLRPLFLSDDQDNDPKENDSTSLNEGGVTSPLTETVWLSPISESMREIEDSSIASDIVDEEVDGDYESTGEFIA